jgi:L-asparagine transporter-like permease
VVSLAAHVVFRRRMTAEEVAHLPMRSPLGSFGSVIGLVVVVATIAKGWWDSPINLVSGILYLVVLTIAYYLLKAQRVRSSAFRE